jgi:uridine phosphorylase
MTEMRKDVHLTGQDLMQMVQLRPEDVGDIALVPGPRERMEAIVQKLENPIKNFSFMEYTMHTGSFKDKKVTTINGGRFAADTSITTEILCNAQVKGMVRLGSCGALREDIKVGDLVVVTNALRGEGVTQYYLEEGVIPEADKDLSARLTGAVKAAKEQNPMLGDVHEGTCWTTDALLKETKEVITPVVAQGAIAADMVTAAFLGICQTYKIPAAVILAVSDNVITGEMGFMNTDYYMAEAAMIDIGLSAI